MKKLLIIDDNDFLREELIEALKFEGFDVLSANNGMNGVEIAQMFVPHLILCDILMHGMDGFEVFGKLKDDATTASIPFVFLTAMAEADEICKGMGLGADEYLIKPISLDYLLKTINQKISETK